jgi:hypothetical protein
MKDNGWYLVDETAIARESGRTDEDDGSAGSQLEEVTFCACGGDVAFLL